MGSDGDEAQDDLHFLFIPLMSQSHLIPFTDLAKLVARHGPKVTVVMTPLNTARFSSVLDHATTHGLRIHFLIFPFPCAEFSLPEGCENLDSLPPTGSVGQFFDASNALQGPIEDWITEGKPDCLVSDICFPWTRNVAGRFGIPRLVFHCISCFTLLCSDRIKRNKVYEGLRSDNERFRVPDFPDEIELTRAQIPTWPDNEDRLDQFKEAEVTADGVMVNTFEELEGKYVKGDKNVVKRLWCVGPVSLDKGELRSVNRGYKSLVDKDSCLNWLDSKGPKSVLYVCFGSLYHMAVSQMIELALGLELSNCSFIWVIRKTGCSSNIMGTLESWLREYDFEKRVSGRGLVIRGWAPQALILAHWTIAGFVTHCGWNSTVEGLSWGLPMITWPMFAEQFYNEKLIVEVLGIGVRVGADVPANQGKDEEEVEGLVAMVSREDVKAAIAELMDDREEGNARRRRAERVGEMAKEAIGVGGSSHLNMDIVIHYVKELLLVHKMNNGDQ